MEDDIKAFTNDIKKIYRDGLLRHENQWPPCREMEPIKLKLCYSTHNILSAGQKGKATIEVSVDYADLFKVASKPKSIRKILVEGDAGTGKTTFCNVISEEWANNNIFPQFDLLLFLPLRQRAIASATTLFDVLKLLHSSKKICSSVAAHLEKNGGDSTLIVADGWDELSGSERQEGSFLYKLLFGEHLRFISVLLTSRSFASASLHNRQFIDRCIKIRGFDKEKIEKYVSSQYPEEIAYRVIKLLTSNPPLDSICSVPLNCAMLCYIQNILGDIPSWTSTTLTDLYKNITLNIIKRNIEKDEPEIKLLFSDFDSLPERLRESWWHQCEFAFQTLVRNQLVFTEESELPANTKGMLSFGLMQSTELHLVSGRAISFHFLHSTFQEFLAALHLERQPPEGKIELCRLHSKSEKFALVWRFFFGICRSKSNKYDCESEKLAIKKIIKSLHRSALTQCHCAFEAQNQIIDSEVTYEAEELNPSTAYDCMAIAHVIANSQTSEPLEIDFSNCSLDDDVVTSIANVFNLTKLDNLQVKQLIVEENRLSGIGVACLFDEAPLLFSSLKLLNLSRNPLGVSGFMELERAASAGILSNLRRLYLQGSLDHELVGDVAENHLSVSFWRALSVHCPKLNVVNLVESDDMENFDLERVPLGLEGAECIGKILSNDVYDEDYDYPGCIDLTSCQLTATELPNSGVRFVSASKKLHTLPKNKNISSLQLDENNFTGNRIHILAGFMKLCPCLNFLYTRDCNINSVDIKHLLSRRRLSKYLTQLERWALDNNRIEDEGVIEFCRFQHSLRVDDEGITFNGNRLSPGMIVRLEGIKGHYLSMLDKITDEECEVSTSDDEDSTEGEESDEEQRNDSPSHDSEIDEEQRINDPDYSPSKDLDTEESDYSEYYSDSGDESTQSSENNHSTSLGMDDSASFEEDAPSNQDSYSLNIDSQDDNEEVIIISSPNRYAQDNNEVIVISSGDENEGTDASTADPELIVSIDKSKIKLVTEKLLPNDLARVYDAAWEARPKWYDLGLELRITPDTLQTIQLNQHADINSCFREMLNEWLRGGHASWSKLADALRAKSVGMEYLAEQLHPKKI